MNTNSTLIGAVVADAATMGLHWIYDQEQLAAIHKTGDVLFRQPDARHYHENKSYFAHGARRVGQGSHYGEMVRACALATKPYLVSEHQKALYSSFGPGGSFVGYADAPTRAFVLRWLQTPNDLPAASGCPDDQLPALCSVPALFAAGEAEHLQAAVSVMSTHPKALEGAKVLFALLKALSTGEPIQSALRTAAQDAKPELRDLLHQALNQRGYSPLAVGQQFGLSCAMYNGLPIVWHLLQHSASFEQVLADNILIGGDSCGRAIALGAAGALLFSVPKELVHQTLSPPLGV